MRIGALVGATLVSALAAGCAGQQGEKASSAAPAKAGVPRFEVDPSWCSDEARPRDGRSSPRHVVTRLD